MLKNPAPVRRWKQALALPLLAVLTLAIGRPAAAQTGQQAAPPPPKPLPQTAQPTKPAVYTYVEQMPQLPGGGGNRAIVEAIQKNIVYHINSDLEGKVFVKFIVQADGAVTGVELVKGLADAYDQAVLDAVKRLPRFVPGRQNNKPVAVSFTVPILFAAKP